MSRRMASSDDPDILSPDELAQLEAFDRDSRGEAARRIARKFDTYFPLTGEFRRELYPKHIEFFAAGAEFPERLFMAANRVGKSEAGAFETTCHLTGIYPDWWPGRRFTKPVEWWACGTTSETTRDIVQGKLLGPWNRSGEGLGMIPAHLVLETTPKPHGLKGSVESAYIQHKSGGKSLVGFKTYEQGRKSFEGTAKDGIWDDEEPPMDVYQEQLLRLLTTQGIMLVTFTPLQGMSEVVMSYVEPTEAAREVKIYVQAGWDDVPHLDERAKKQQIAGMLPYQIAARTRGEPSLGVGAIYPIPEEDISIADFNVPWTWPRGYGMDVGWNRTAVAFFTVDVGADIYYLYDVHYASMGEPPTHAMAVRARGDFLEGVIDPASRGRNQEDGNRLIDAYKECGLTLLPADHAVEAGLQAVWTLLVSGRLKVFKRCEAWFREFRKYHRDEKGAIVKANDHLMDATRYWALSGRDKMRMRPRTKLEREMPTLPTGKTWMR